MMISMRVGVAMAVMTMAGCRTPYQSHGLRGGYDETALGGGTWSVKVEVNGYTSQGTALEYAYRRAGEICRAGFDVVDGSRSQRDNYVNFGNGNVQNMARPEVSLIVQCRAPRVMPAIVSGPPGGIP
jgi:hypothetical protein